MTSQTGNQARRPQPVRGTAQAVRPAPLPGRHPAGHGRRHPGHQGHPLRHGPVGGGPERRPAGPAPHPQRSRRVQRGVHAGRRPAVHLRPPGPRCRLRQGRVRRRRRGAVAAPARRCRGPCGGPPALRPGRRARRGRRRRAARRVRRAADGTGRRRRRESLRTERKDAKVAAILHDSYPVRYWDHDLGPQSPHWFVGRVTPGLVAPAAGVAEPRIEPGRRHPRRARRPGGAARRHHPGRDHGGHHVGVPGRAAEVRHQPGGDRRRVRSAARAGGRRGLRRARSRGVAGRPVGGLQPRDDLDAAAGAAGGPGGGAGGGWSGAAAHRRLGPVAVPCGVAAGVRRAAGGGRRRRPRAGVPRRASRPARCAA